ncbi:hypothetical protein WDZ16_09930 [Pseudokineococcus marinus]|uniref:DUF1579 domain-containing protein n=1 Tax=Pseudokineococcus marinus TaxID=351215 RepID=A0A849BFQ9_9ACTN|nr:hypothetical protein [Pseudokineococcus marinus]NNH21910.1 hypothetical protein [Pseudokineococcus marinus]
MVEELEAHEEATAEGSATPAQAPEDPLLSAPPTPAPLVGTWEASGEVLGEDGTTVVGAVAGTDVYRWLGPTVVHEVDVEVAGRRTRALEVLEPFDPALGAFPTRAYDDAGGVASSTASVDAAGTWTFRAPGARATLRVADDGAAMSAEWVRETPGGDVPWMRLAWRRTP